MYVVYENKIHSLIHSFIHCQLAYTIPGVVLSSIKSVIPPTMYTIHLLIKLLKKGALVSQPQVIKRTSCLLMFGGSLDLLSTGILNTHSLSRVVVPATLHSISVNAHFTRFLLNLETVKKCT